MRLFLLIAALCLPTPLLAQGAIGAGEGVKEDTPTEAKWVYVYIDGSGQLHFVDRLDLVPAQYRSRVRKTSLVTQTVNRDDAVGAAARKRRDARVKAAYEARQEEAKARQAAAKKALERAESTDEPKRAPTREERLADALTERREILEELAALEEGYAEDVDQSEADLLARIDHLDERLRTLDASITSLRSAE